MNGVLLTTMLALFGVIAAGITKTTSSRNSEPEMPPAQASFLSQLEDYRTQYSAASSKRNDIQMNRIYDARKMALCAVDPNVRGWTGTVRDVSTGFSRSQRRAFVTLNIPNFNDNITFSGENIYLKEDPELFEVLADLKRGDKIQFSGTFDYSTGCVREISLTQTFGMEWPEFRFTYSEINGVRSNKINGPIGFSGSGKSFVKSAKP